MQKQAWVGIYWLSRAGLLLPRRLIPTAVGYAVAAGLADLSFFLFASARQTLIANLRPVVQDEKAAHQAARQAFRNYGRYIVDLFQLPALGPSVVRDRVAFDDWRALTGPGDSARGTIFVTLHLGQWEMGAAALAAFGYPVSVVAQTLEYAPMNDLVQGLRRQLGMQIIAGEKAALQMFRCLARNEMLGMLIDVVEPGEGVKVDFFGRETEMSGAPARIALRTGARVVLAALARDPARPAHLKPVIDADFTFSPTGREEQDVVALTQLIARSFEALVFKFPDQWFAFRPGWKAPSRSQGESPPATNVARQTTREARRNHIALTIANAVFGRFPKVVNYWIAAYAGDLAFALRKSVRSDVQDNIRHVLGPEASVREVEVTAREAVRNVCRYYADLIRLPHTSGRQLLACEITIHGFEHLTQALSDGRGAVVATAHFGNPEVAVQVGAELGLNLVVLSEPLSPPEFSQLVHRLRSANGVDYAEVGFRTIGRVLSHLRGGGVLAITCDRDIQRTGALIPFFGRQTHLPLGAVELAAKTGAALVPGYCRRVGQRFEVVFEAPIEMVRTGRPKKDALVNACRLLSRVEAWIRSDPGQWMVLERIWRAAPDGAGNDSTEVEMEARPRETAGV